MILTALLAVLVSGPALTPAPDAQIERHGDHLTLKGGIVWINTDAFTDGVVSAELRLPATRGFTGLLFRARDGLDGELIYLRHHQRGNPDAWQYHPRHNGHQAYQIYQGEGFAGTASWRVDEWIRVELHVAGDRAELFVDGEPIARVDDLQTGRTSGRIGFWGLLGERDIRQVEIARTAPRLTQRQVDAPAEIEGALIESWSVSAPLPESAVAQAMTIADITVSAGDWTTVPATHRGIADLNTVAPLGPESDTVLARHTIEAAEAGPVLFDFGFSDRARVFLNGRLLYTGADEFRSRDYRFLGTVGRYDTLVLPLQEGTNELIVAVSETEGGWALTGALRIPGPASGHF